MKKLTNHAMILWGILLVVTAVLAVALPFAHSDVFWIAAVCDLIMFAAVAVVYGRAFRMDGTMESKLLGWPIFKAGLLALAAQIIVGFVLMALAAVCPVWVAVIVEIFLFAAALAVLTVRDAARTANLSSERAARDQTAQWKSIRQSIAAIASETGSEEIRRLADEIRYSDPMPTALDGKVAETVARLRGGVTEDDVRALAQLIQERNRAAKAAK